jgi:valyl-tRNA synthetase
VETLLRLFAPFVPFAAEEAWSWFRDGSVHRAPWPTPGTLPESANPDLLTLTGEALVGIRRAKTDAKASQKTQVASAVIAGPDGKVELLQLAEGDLRAVGRIEDLSFEHGPDVRVSRIVLAPSDEL